MKHDVLDSNQKPPVNRGNTTDLPRVASDCVTSPDRKSEAETSDSIDDQKNRSDATVWRSEPRLGVSKGQGKGNAKSG